MKSMRSGAVHFSKFTRWQQGHRRFIAIVLAAVMTLTGVVAGGQAAVAADYNPACGSPCNNVSSSNQVLATEIKGYFDNQKVVATANYGNPAARNQIYYQEILPYASGGTPAANCEVATRILQIAVVVLRKFGSIQINEMNRACPGALSDTSCVGSSSVHCLSVAQAIDFGGVGGISTGGGNSDNTLALLDFVSTFVPQGTHAEQRDCRTVHRWPVLDEFQQTPCSVPHQHLDLRNISGDLKVDGSGSSTPGTGASSPMMLIDNVSAVWAKQPGDFSTAWTRETVQPGGIVKIASGGGIQMAMDSTGVVYARSDVSTSTAWIRETTGSGQKDIAIGSDGTQMLIDGVGAVWAKKPGDLSTAWTRETVQPGGIVKIASGGGIQMAMDSTGVVYARSDVSTSTAWIRETTGSGQKDIAIGSDGTQMLIDGVSAVWAKKPGDLSTAWTRETVQPGGIVKIASGGGIQMAMDSTGVVYARSDVSTSTAWNRETTGNGQKAIAICADGAQLSTDGVGAVWAKRPGDFSTAWTKISTDRAAAAIACG